MSSDADAAAVGASGLPKGWNDTATSYERDASLAKVLERCIDDALRARQRPAGQ